jgi:hypothetical protein
MPDLMRPEGLGSELANHNGGGLRTEGVAILVGWLLGLRWVTVCAERDGENPAR